MNKIFVLLVFMTFLIAGCDNSNNSSDSANNFIPKFQTTLGLRNIYGLESNNFVLGEPITFDLQLTNLSNEEVTLNFTTGQQYDFYIKASSGVDLWRWSVDESFVQSQTSLEISGGESVVVSVTWDQSIFGVGNPGVGNYTVYGSFLDQSPLAQFSFTIQEEPEPITLERHLKQGLAWRTDQITIMRHLIENSIFTNDTLDVVAVADNTNVQEEGVDEADTIEFDGDTIFIAKENTVQENSKTYSTIDAYSSDSSTAETRLLGSVQISDSSKPTLLRGIYLRNAPSENRLVVLDTIPNIFRSSYEYYYNNRTAVTLVNVDNPAGMKIEQRWEIDGVLISSRRIENFLYLVTAYIPDSNRAGLIQDPESQADKNHNKSILNRLQLQELLPVVRADNANSWPLISESDCHIPKDSQTLAPNNHLYGGLVVISVIDLDNPINLQSKCLAGNTDSIYASQETLYLLKDSSYTSYSLEKNYWEIIPSTSIYKYALQGVNVEFRAEGSVLGKLPCRPFSYCVGERDGVLRLLSQKTTGAMYSPIWGWSSWKYVLNMLEEDGNSNLTIVSSLPNEERPQAIGKPGELVYSMRSYKDYAYIVTFDKVDPLYVIDLSNPDDPFIAGELEVTGFSDYLHPIGSDLLLGIGKEAVYDSEFDISWYQGIKIELFDVSDPLNPTSIASDVIGKRGSDSTVLYNPHAFSSAQTNGNETLLAFPVKVANRLPINGDSSKPYQSYEWERTALYVYKVVFDEFVQSGLNRVGFITAEKYHETDNVSDSNIFTDRSVFHNSTVHYLHNNKLISKHISNLE